MIYRLRMSEFLRPPATAGKRRGLGSISLLGSHGFAVGYHLAPPTGAKRREQRFSR